MKKKFQTYFPMIVTLVFLYCYGAYFRLAFLFEETIVDELNNLIMICGIGMVITTIIILVEIVYFMVKAIKQKDALWAVLIYLFNVFVIPYYNVKHVMKDKRANIIRNIYIGLAIGAFIGGILVTSFQINKYSLNENTEIKQNITETYKTDDDRVSFILKGDFEQKEIGEYDLYLSRSDGQFNFGVFTYPASEYDITAEELLEEQISYIKETRSFVKLISQDTKVLEDKIIETYVYSGYKDASKNIYSMSTITFTDADYFVYVLEIVIPEEYENNKEYYSQILETATLYDFL